MSNPKLFATYLRNAVLCLHLVPFSHLLLFPAFVTVLFIGYVASPIRDSDFGITSRRRRAHVYVTRLGPNSIPDLGRRRDADICK